MDVILDQNKEWVLQPSWAAAVSQECQTLSFSLTESGLLTHSKHWSLWNIAIMNHTLEHICQDATELNLRLCWKYGPVCSWGSGFQDLNLARCQGVSKNQNEHVVTATTKNKK